jgi:hypothetical protein
MSIVTDSTPAAPAPVLLPLQTFLKLYSPACARAVKRLPSSSSGAAL